jgi:hypothetical protein
MNGELFRGSLLRKERLFRGTLLKKGRWGYACAPFEKGAPVKTSGGKKKGRVSHRTVGFFFLRKFGESTTVTTFFSFFFFS